MMRAGKSAAPRGRKEIVPAMRKTSLMLLGAATGVALTMVAILPPLALGQDASPGPSGTNYRALDLFGDTFARVRSRYVEPPNEGKLIESAINGMLAGLEDSYYVDPQSAKTAQTCSGQSCPIGELGLVLTVADGLIKVITAIEDTPAAKAGLMAGDIIAEIDDESAQGLNYYQAAAKLRGDLGQKVNLTLLRPGRGAPVRVAVTRDRSTPLAVRARPEGGDVGYIRISQFDAQTVDQLRQAIKDITGSIASDKLKGYVIDLRNNPGGTLEQGIAVADAFLEDGEIVSIRSRKPEDTQRFRAKTGDIAGGKPLVVLLNAGSAAAAEIVAGALQDHHRATLVGTRSFGEGAVATLIPLGRDAGVIHLTTGHYVTPSGRVIEKKGISPDVEVAQDLPDDLKPTSKAGGDQATLQSWVPADPQADKALARAFELLRKTAQNTTPSRRAKATLPK
jgi:carboxyl-terminal processing protease